MITAPARLVLHVDHELGVDVRLQVVLALGEQVRVLERQVECEPRHVIDGLWRGQVFVRWQGKDEVWCQWPRRRPV